MVIQNFSFELLKIFVKVAETKNISKAAEELFISQPAVSQSIKKLESEVGGKLFYRTNKGLVLTEEGSAFNDYVKNALMLINQGVDVFHNYKEFKVGTINIGIPTSLTKIVLTNAMQKFHKQYPNIKFNIVNELSSNLVKQLEIGRLDFVIINDSEEEYNNLNKQELKKLKHCFVYNPDFFEVKENLTIKELLTKSLILQKKESNTRIVLDKYLLSRQLIATPEIEVVSQNLAIFFASIGLGFAYCLEDVVNDKNLKIVSLQEELPFSKITLLTNKNKSISFAGKKFLEFLLDK